LAVDVEVPGTRVASRGAKFDADCPVPGTLMRFGERVGVGAGVDCSAVVAAPTPENGAAAPVTGWDAG
jgi:hypothetical protein